MKSSCFKKIICKKKWIRASINVEHNPNIMICCFHQCPLQYCKIEIRGGFKWDIFWLFLDLQNSSSTIHIDCLWCLCKGLIFFYRFGRHCWFGVSSIAWARASSVTLLYHCRSSVALCFSLYHYVSYFDSCNRGRAEPVRMIRC